MDNNRALYKYEYDLLRIVLTLLVVIGHAAYYNIVTPFGGIYYQTNLEQLGLDVALSQRIITYISLWISSFHMPGFFMLSGMLYIINDNSNSLIFLVSRKVKRLIVPLLFVWFAWNIPIKYISGYYDGIQAYKILLQVFFPNRVYLWYLEALFFVFIVAYIMHYFIKHYWWRMGISVILAVIGILLSKVCGDYIPLGNPLKYVLWFEFGCCFQNFRKWLVKKKLWTTKICISVLLIHFALYLSAQLFSVHNGLIEYMIFPFTIIPSIIYLCELVSNKFGVRYADILKKISAYSFGVYLYAEPINYLILFIFARVAGVNAFSLEFVSLALIVLRISVSIIVAVIVVRILKFFNLKYLY